MNLMTLDPAVTLNVSTALVTITDSDSKLVAILLHTKHYRDTNLVLITKGHDII